MLNLTDLDWPPRQADHAGGEYVRYAQIYDALFDDLNEDAGFYGGLAAREPPKSGELLELGIGMGRSAES